MFVPELTASITDGIALLDAQGRYLYVNAAAEALTGTSAADLIGRHYSECFPDLVGTPFEAIYQDAAKTREKRGARLPIGPLWFEFRFYPMPDGGMFVLFEDATARVKTGMQRRAQAERALRASEERFRRIVETAAEGIWIVDENGATSFVNAKMTELLGYTQEEFFRSCFRDFLHPEDVDRGVAGFASRLRGDVSPHEYRFRHKDGSIKWFSISANRVDDEQGAFLGLLGMFTDVTERKQREFEHAEREVRMSLALHAGKMGTWMHDLETKETLWSETHFRVFGLEPELKGPTHDQWIKMLHPEDVRGVLDALDRSARDRSLFAKEYRIVLPDDSIRWLEARGQYVYDQSGRPVKMSGVVMDVTERKQTEEAMRNRQRLESIGLLAGGIAHDFNNLLTGIIGGTTFALDALPEDHPAYPMLRVASSASERAAHLTRQMLAYSGRGRFLIESIDLGLLVTETCALISASLRTGVTIDNQTTPGTVRINGDSGQVQQVVLNLLLNAVESIAPPAAGRVTARISHQTLQAVEDELIAFDVEPGDFVCLEVSDTGTGMSEETRRRIFEPFFTTKFTGRGLGLAAVIGIVRGHKGALRVISAPGEGTTFRVWFPAHAAAGVPVAPASVPGRVQRGTILIIDDEDVVRRAGGAALRRAGFVVVEASEGTEGLAILERDDREISLVLLDLSMPGMDGIETLAYIRRIRKDLPVVICSGFSEFEVANRFSETDISGVLEKPFTAQQIVRQVQSVLSKAASA